MTRSKSPIPFTNWSPDQGLVSGWGLAKGVLSKGGKYVPWPSFAIARDGARTVDSCIGAVGVYSSTGAPTTFLGDTRKLYRMASGMPADVSKSGGYTADADWAWSFMQFGDNIIAAARGVTPQRFVLGSSTQFADIANTPTNVDVAFRVRAHGFLCGGRTINVSAFNDVTDWTPDFATQAFQATIGQEAGLIVAGYGGEQGAIFQERGITRVTYVGGEVPFQLDEVEGGRGACGPNAIAPWGKGAFVAAEDGLYYFDGMEAQPIGAGVVDGWFSDRLNYPYRHRVCAAIDAARKLVMFALPSQSPVCDTLLCYSWSDKRWTYDEQNVQHLFSMPRDGISLDDTAAVEAQFGTSDLDLINVSVDSPLWRESRHMLAAVNESREVCRMDGTARPATMDTGEFEPIPGRQTYVSELWPVCDASAGVTGTVMTRAAKLADSATASDSGAMIDDGFVPVRAEGRYVRGRIEISGGATWSEASGLHWDGSVAGGR